MHEVDGGGESRSAGDFTTLFIESGFACRSFTTELLTVADVMLTEEVGVLEDVTRIKTMHASAYNTRLLIGIRGRGRKTVDTSGIDVVQFATVGVSRDLDVGVQAMSKSAGGVIRVSWGNVRRGLLTGKVEVMDASRAFAGRGRRGLWSVGLRSGHLCSSMMEGAVRSHEVLGESLDDLSASVLVIE